MVGKEAAIPGGMDIEQTYRLIDTYIQECERLQTVEAVKNLQYNMLIDFTQRISQQHAPAHLSEDVFAATQYISTHLNEPIGVDDVVAHNGKSRAYLCKKISRRTGHKHCRLHFALPPARSQIAFALYRKATRRNQQLSMLF